MPSTLPDSGDILRHRPPLTNRGVQTHSEKDVPGAWGRVDYLKLTVWGEVGEVASVVERGVVAEFFPDAFTQWEDVAAGGRAERVMRAVPGLFVVQYKGAPYCSVEAKGEVCEFIGNAGCSRLGHDLKPFPRVRASRLDVAWDGVPFTVADVRNQLTGPGGVRTRLRLPGVPEFFESESGRTVYLGDKRKGEVFARFYDKRGPVRFEQVWKGDWAAGAWMMAQRAGVESWPSLFISLVREGFDLVERSVRPDLAAQWGPWAEFVAAAERASLVRVPRETEITEWGRVEATVLRAARVLEAAQRAFGADWLSKRLSAVAAKRWGPEDDAFVEGLCRWCVLATGHRSDDPPI